MLLWIFFSLLIATIRANSLIQEIMSIPQVMKEIGLFLPVVTWRLATGKESPFDISSPAVCIRTPFTSENINFQGITLEVSLCSLKTYNY